MADTSRRCFMVADGMGGVAGGDIASTIFLDTVKSIFTSEQEGSPAANRLKVETCFSLANAKMIDHTITHPELSGMGCTAELMTFAGNTFTLGHIGDSRTYCFIDNSLQQLTKDHSLVQEQLEQGIISQEQADSSRYHNLLLRAVGTEPSAKIDIISGAINPGTIFLLCSDGLYNMVDTVEIVSVLSFDAPLPLKANMLVDMANDSGGKDNISITLVEFPDHI